MARIFTTSFEFNKKNYDAIITILSKDNQVTFNIQVLDADLFDLIPGGRLSYEGKDGFREIEAVNNTLAQSLMKSITKAIEGHLVP